MEVSMKFFAILCFLLLLGMGHFSIASLLHVGFSRKLASGTTTMEERGMKKEEAERGQAVMLAPWGAHQNCLGDFGPCLPHSLDVCLLG